MAETEKTEKKNGGRRAGSGRKPALNKDKLAEVKEQIEKHAVVSVAIEGERKKKARFLHLLDTLFDKGLTGDVPAIREYFDRTTGKAPQPIEGVKGKPILISDE